MCEAACPAELGVAAAAGARGPRRRSGRGAPPHRTWQPHTATWAAYKVWAAFGVRGALWSRTCAWQMTERRYKLEKTRGSVACRASATTRKGAALVLRRASGVLVHGSLARWCSGWGALSASCSIALRCFTLPGLWCFAPAPAFSTACGMELTALPLCLGRGCGGFSCYVFLSHTPRGRREACWLV